MITCPALFMPETKKRSNQEIIPMARDLYLNPVGLLYGGAAREAIGSGNAGRLGGGDIGFNAVQILQGKPGRIKRDMRSYHDVHSSNDKTIVSALHSLEQARCLTIKSEHAGPLLMGVVNVTPDSFSDGGDFLDGSVAIAHGNALVSAGADILDIGGESTRPGSEQI